MADSKITALTSIGTSTDPANDPLVLVDVSDTSMAATGTTKKVTLNNLLSTSPTASGNFTITGDLTVDTSTLKVDSANNRVGVGTASPAYTLHAVVASGFAGAFRASTGVAGGLLAGNTAGDLVVGVDASGNGRLTADSSKYLGLGSNGINDRAILDSSGNLGLGVTPSAWNSSYKAIQIGSIGSLSSVTTNMLVGANYYRSAGADTYIANGFATLYLQSTGAHQWYTAASGTAGNAITFTQAMTLDASGNLLVGTTSGTSHNLRKQGSTVEGDTHLNVGNAEHLFFACSSVTYNAAAAAYKITRNSSTSRSINAGGTINASGADYAEYMTKAGNFSLAKGDVAGIDANGKLTNVFADAVSFVVKSTDPSYVGNDKWGVDLEGADLETARQLVDRIAFAGQIPVNVTGASAGDYIVPVADGSGIKGVAIKNPTFEQYQIAVGKVIAIETDGRARIIVKVS